MSKKSITIWVGATVIFCTSIMASSGIAIYNRHQVHQAKYANIITENHKVIKEIRESQQKTGNDDSVHHGQETNMVVAVSQIFSSL